MRTVPQAKQAEEAVLGGLMLAPDTLDAVTGVLTEEDFYVAEHRAIYRAILELAGHGSPFDAITLGDWMESHQEKGRHYDTGLLVELATTTPSAANIMAYAAIVRDKAVMRRLIAVGTEIVDSAFQPSGRDSHTVLEDAQGALAQLSTRAAADTSTRSAKECMSALARQMRDRLNAVDGELLGSPTGLTDLDAMINGLVSGQLVVLAARPSMGKTALGLKFARAACHKGGHAMIFSMEMAGEQLMARILASESKVNLTSIIDPKRLEEHEFGLITAGTIALRDFRITTDDSTGLAVEQICARARRVHAEEPVGIVVVDYLQLCRYADPKQVVTSVQHITRSLKGLARQLDIPVVLLSQLNRGVESRADKRPFMSDLRESGAIEQDADVVLLLYRDDYYNVQSVDVGVLEIAVAKQRNGPTGTVKVAFLRETQELGDLSKLSDQRMAR